jgi:4-diphosphocytidyl-2-C-methyl-D-erythritol kinase
MSTEPVAVRVRVPAKVNLFLAVRGRRTDGMHEIVSIMLTVGLFDEVGVRFDGPREAFHHPATRQRMDVIFEQRTGPPVPVGQENLVVVAARAIAARMGTDVRLLAPGARGEAGGGTVSMWLAKSIPVAAGMAGGSADAAAALVGLNTVWECGLDRDDLREVAAQVGADVPFCVTGGTALATGTGVATAQVLCRGVYDWVVAVDDQPLSTAEVYAKWDDIGRPSRVEPDAVLQALRSRDPEALGAALHNDLQEAAFALRPRLREWQEALVEAGALGAVISGSGPTLIALAGDAEHAGRIAERVREAFHRVEIVQSPAGGPDVSRVTPGQFADGSGVTVE